MLLNVLYGCSKTWMSIVAELDSLLNLSVTTSACSSPFQIVYYHLFLLMSISSLWATLTLPQIVHSYLSVLVFSPGDASVTPHTVCLFFGQSIISLNSLSLPQLVIIPITPYSLSSFHTIYFTLRISITEWSSIFSSYETCHPLRLPVSLSRNLQPHKVIRQSASHVLHTKKETKLARSPINAVVNRENNAR